MLRRIRVCHVTPVRTGNVGSLRVYRLPIASIVRDNNNSIRDSPYVSTVQQQYEKDAHFLSPFFRVTIGVPLCCATASRTRHNILHKSCLSLIGLNWVQLSSKDQYKFSMNPPYVIIYTTIQKRLIFW